MREGGRDWNNKPDKTIENKVGAGREPGPVPAAGPSPGLLLLAPAIGILSAQSIGDTLKKWATLIISVLSGSPSNEASVSDGSLTERDYLAIGICAGFLVMLYIFAMIVFVVIRRKQKKDRRLREQFLQVPAPEGIGFKSSR